MLNSLEYNNSMLGLSQMFHCHIDTDQDNKYDTYPHKFDLKNHKFIKEMKKNTSYLFQFTFTTLNQLSTIYTFDQYHQKQKQNVLSHFETSILRT